MSAKSTQKWPRGFYSIYPSLDYSSLGSLENQKISSKYHGNLE